MHVIEMNGFNKCLRTEGGCILISSMIHFIVVFGSLYFASTSWDEAYFTFKFAELISLISPTIADLFHDRFVKQIPPYIFLLWGWIFIITPLYFMLGALSARFLSKPRLIKLASIGSVTLIACLLFVLSYFLFVYYVRYFDVTNNSTVTKNEFISDPFVLGKSIELFIPFQMMPFGIGQMFNYLILRFSGGKN
jgi:hypothetical protein